MVFGVIGYCDISHAIEPQENYALNGPGGVTIYLSTPLVLKRGDRYSIVAKNVEINTIGRYIIVTPLNGAMGYGRKMIIPLSNILGIIEGNNKSLTHIERKK